MEDKEELPGQVIIDLEPVTCSLRMNHTLERDAVNGASLSMKARLPRGVKFRTPDERSLSTAEWGLTLYGAGAGSQFSERHNAVGQLDYLSEIDSEVDDDGFPESCAAWAILDGDTFNLIRDMALAGKLPVVFRLHVRGIEYGWEPDGSGKVWDIKTHPNTVITEVEVITHFVRPSEGKAEDKEIDPFWIEPAPPSPELFAMREIAKTVRELNSRLGWTLGLVALMATVMLLR